MRCFILACTLLGPLLSGCAGDAPAAFSDLGTAESAILGGSIDTTHPAVVAVLGIDYSCTGTIVQVSGGVGYVLTAAHCCPSNDLPRWIVAASDYNISFNHQSPAPPAYPIVPGSALADSCYQGFPGSTDDVCMLKFSNAAGLPTLPVMTPQTDNLVLATKITFVGYGLTASPPGGGNSTRRFVDKAVGKLTPYFMDYDSPSVSGTCEGDSGGPALAVVNGQEVIAAITSFGDKGCTVLGTSIRASAVYTHFIAPYLADQATSPSCPADTDCSICSQAATQHGDCVDVTQNCLDDPACGPLVSCYNGCTTVTCMNACTTQNVAGLSKYAAIEECICATSCTMACKGAPFCIGAKCGLKMTDPTCTSCVEASCCAEAWACQSDVTCRKCFGANPPAACANSPKAADYYACAAKQCDCSISSPGSTVASSAASTSGATSSAGVGGGAGTTAQTGAGGQTSTPSTTVGGCATSGQPPGELPVGALSAGLLGLLTIRAKRRRASHTRFSVKSHKGDRR